MYLQAAAVTRTCTSRHWVTATAAAATACAQCIRLQALDWQEAARQVNHLVNGQLVKASGRLLFSCAVSGTAITSRCRSSSCPTTPACAAVAVAVHAGCNGPYCLLLPGQPSCAAAAVAATPSQPCWRGPPAAASASCCSCRLLAGGCLPGCVPFTISSSRAAGALQHIQAHPLAPAVTCPGNRSTRGRLRQCAAGLQDEGQTADGLAQALQQHQDRGVFIPLHRRPQRMSHSKRQTHEPLTTPNLPSTCAVPFAALMNDCS